MPGSALLLLELPVAVALEDMPEWERFTPVVEALPVLLGVRAAPDPLRAAEWLLVR